MTFFYFVLTCIWLSVIIYGLIKLVKVIKKNNHWVD